MPRMTRAGYVPPKRLKARKQRKKAAKRGRKKKRRISAASVVSLVVFALAAAVGAGTLWLFSRTAQYQNAFLPGTYLLGGSLGGLTYEEGVSLLHAMTDEALSGWNAVITAQGEEYALTAEDVSLSLDADATLEPLWEEGRGGMLPAFRAMLSLGAQPKQAELAISYDMDAADALLARIRTAVERKPTDATARYLPGSSEPFRFTQEAVGYRLDTAPLREQLVEALCGLASVELEAQPEEIAPKVYSADLREATVLRGRAVVTAEADENALLNAMLAAQALNGLTLAPGEKLSFNEAVGARTAARGYASAPEPAYGETAEGIGGGVCRTATALYQAALLGCVKVTAHSAAARPVPYAEAGLEAAVSGTLDLEIENDTGMPLYVAARAYRDGEQDYVEAQLIGAPLSSRYALETTLIETPAPEEPVYVRDSEGRYAVFDDERVPVLEAKPGYKASVERVELDEDGVERSRETVFEGEYAPQAQAIYVGVNARE